ncbi:MAG: 16S rRNA (cytosine(1402)-N(4))-methyltransferase RsmH [Gammaproteobacteria bacterium]|nr:16S rRNA (cytosine(1402)-N(4))-methyltransferase RsmH [Gammaproteobacteria bacterium]
MSEHRPVLLHETLEALAVTTGGHYVDATYGRGGHTRAILEQLGADGNLLVMDRDPEAIAAARENHSDDARVTIVSDAFANIGNAIAAAGWQAKVDGLLLDLGVSSPQLEQAERGFSFQHDAPLDMRMDNTGGLTAADWIAQADVVEIGSVLRSLGEERFYKRISRAIVEARETASITRTGQLAEIVSAAVPVREPGRHPATRVFQALRIQVNDELGQLEAALKQSVDVLAPGGRLCVISFHSLEDRIVKRFMRRLSLVDQMWRGLPQVPAHAQAVFERPRPALRPGREEQQQNPRSRSAVLRVAERCK